MGQTISEDPLLICLSCILSVLFSPRKLIDVANLALSEYHAGSTNMDSKLKGTFSHLGGRAAWIMGNQSPADSIPILTQLLSTISIDFVRYLTSFSSIATIVAILCLLAFYIYGRINSSPTQGRLIGTIVEVAILAGIFIWNAYLNRREMKLRGREVRDRVKGIIMELEAIRHQAGQVTMWTHSFRV